MVVVSPVVRRDQVICLFNNFSPEIQNLETVTSGLDECLEQRSIVGCESKCTDGPNGPLSVRTKKGENKKSKIKI